jgi:outer membrane protein OmpA-like peptidoglycan-associated protein
VLGWQMGVDPTAGGTAIVEKVVEKEKLVSVAQAPTTGRVQGQVTDADTKKPLAEAVVQVPGRNRILTEADGRFVLEAIEPGPVKVVATKPGYEPREMNGKVDKGGLLTLNVSLPPLPPEPPKPMAVRGSVLNEQEKPIVATISIAAAGVSQKSNATGEFTFSVPAGEQIVEASAAGYLTQAQRLTGEPGDSLVVNFVLKPVPKQSLVVLKKDKIEIKKQVHFATNRDVILPDSAPLLDEVAATILEHDNLKLIRIEGHTDDQGDDSHNLDLSNRRAMSVLRALRERGVAESRLKSVGYGETKPIADNKKPAGRALNRRVEFMIEQQE